jgi:hypothetical protein
MTSCAAALGPGKYALTQADRPPVRDSRNHYRWHNELDGAPHEHDCYNVRRFVSQASAIKLNAAQRLRLLAAGCQLGPILRHHRRRALHRLAVSGRWSTVAKDASQYSRAASHRGRWSV